MIIGILDTSRPAEDLKRELLAAAQQAVPETGTASPQAWAQGHIALCAVPQGIVTLDEGPQPFVSEDGSAVMVFEGKVYNAEELCGLLRPGHRLSSGWSGEALVHLYEEKRDDFLEKVVGKFTFALWDGGAERLLLGRDRLGVESMFYCGDGPRLVFGSSLTALMTSGLVEKRLSHHALSQYLLYGYNPGDETMLSGVRRLPAGHVLSLEGGQHRLRRYWRLSFAERRRKSEREHCDEIVGLMREAVGSQLDGASAPGVFLSGGTDSSAIVALASQMWPGPLRTFSFRCQGRSYDESSHARFVAERTGTQHTEVSYEPECLSLMSRAVEHMDEPFSDIGIEMATFLLGQAAQDEVSYVFSGEGGDELFAGHPVYTADKVAAFIDPIPKALVTPVARALQKVPDSDQKRNVQVKLKRFAYSLGFPRELLSHRWRTYYTPAELRQLCAGPLLQGLDGSSIYADMARLAREADGRDTLSRSLYSDYYTLVSFYLRRLQLLRAFGIESRLPLMDHRLVEYAATIPSDLKLKGMSGTKYIYRKALEGTVPREILYERPKLGHSVPMKNWLREDAWLMGWMDDLLFGGVLEDTGLFKMDYVRRLVRQHRARSENHSHRLWGLAVLSLWLGRWMGVTTPCSPPY